MRRCGARPACAVWRPLELIRLRHQGPLRRPPPMIDSACRKPGHPPDLDNPTFRNPSRSSSDSRTPGSAADRGRRTADFAPRSRSILDVVGSGATDATTSMMLRDLASGSCCGPAQAARARAARARVAWAVRAVRAVRAAWAARARAVRVAWAARVAWVARARVARVAWLVRVAWSLSGARALVVGSGGPSAGADVANDSAPKDANGTVRPGLDDDARTPVNARTRTRTRAPVNARTRTRSPANAVGRWHGPRAV
ncbi:hypothetical protein PSN13_02690 [Micromonospora saelicesensis]|uniref:Uncharacterized protein n=1 Tax=Micromonospora saelicesensis TaxID=285676 RepID=A0A328NP65_9ACTN|nr:hypothetical protein PSN13_02690 [Micromonospora saelicesensis]